MGGSTTPPSQDRSPQQIADDESEEEARREQLAFNRRERQRVESKIKETEAKLAKEKGLTEARKAQEKSARARNLRGFPSLLGGGGFTGFTLDSDAERRRREGLTAAERERLAAEEAERKRLAAEEAEQKRLADLEAERKRLADEEAARKRQAAAETEQATARKAVKSTPVTGRFGALIASKDPQIRAAAAVASEPALGVFGVLRASEDAQIRARAEVRTRSSLGRFGGDIAEGQVSSRELTEKAVKVDLTASGVDPDDPTKTLGGEPLTPLQLEKVKGIMSFQGFNPPLGGIAKVTGPALTTRQIAEEKQKIALVAGGFDPDDPTKAASGRDLTPLEIQKRAGGKSILKPLSGRQKEELRIGVALEAKGFDPKDPTKTLAGKTLTPLQVEQRKRIAPLTGPRKGSFPATREDLFGPTPKPKAAPKATAPKSSSLALAKLEIARIATETAAKAAKAPAAKKPSLLSGKSARRPGESSIAFLRRTLPSIFG